MITNSIQIKWLLLKNTDETNHKFNYIEAKSPPHTIITAI